MKFIFFLFIASCYSLLAEGINETQLEAWSTEKCQAYRHMASVKLVTKNYGDPNNCKSGNLQLFEGNTYGKITYIWLDKVTYKIETFPIESSMFHISLPLDEFEEFYSELSFLESFNKAGHSLSPMLHTSENNQFLKTSTYHEKNSNSNTQLKFTYELNENRVDIYFSYTL